MSQVRTHTRVEHTNILFNLFFSFTLIIRSLACNYLLRRHNLRSKDASGATLIKAALTKAALIEAALTKAALTKAAWTKAALTAPW